MFYVCLFVTFVDFITFQGQGGPSGPLGGPGSQVCILFFAYVNTRFLSIKAHVCVCACDMFYNRDLVETRTITKLGFSSLKEITNYLRLFSIFQLNFFSETKMMNGLKFKARETHDVNENILTFAR